MGKKIYLVVTPLFPSHDILYGSYVLDQVKAIMRTDKYRVVVMRPKKITSKLKDYEYDGVRVIYFNSIFMPSYFFNGLTNTINNFFFRKKLVDIGIKYEDIAVVHSHTGVFASFAASIKKRASWIKSLLQYHDSDPYQIRIGFWADWKPNTIFRARSIIRLFKYIDYHICISKKVEDNLLNFPNPSENEYYDSYLNVLRNVKNIKRPDLKSIILYNGVDKRKFYKKQNKKNDGIFRIGCIGNFVESKGHLTLFKAVDVIRKEGSIPNIQVSVIGHGREEYTNVLHQFVKDNNLDDCIFFEKEVLHNKLVDYYNSLDLFVLPSYYEGFGCVYTEAAACGVPYIMCKGQGAAEYIPEEDKDRWLIEKDDYNQLAIEIVNFYKYRYKQKYKHPYDIDVLIEEFLSKIEND